MSDEDQGAPTPMRLSEAEPWEVSSPVRRVGWLDEKGRAYTVIPPTAEFDGGSLTPLLIEIGND